MRGKRTAGMTLIELMIAVGLASIVLAAAGGAMVAGARGYRVNHNLESDQYNTRMALMSITKEVRGGASEINTGEGFLVMSVPDGVSGAIPVRYELKSDGVLYKNDDSMGVELEKFWTDFDGSRITLVLEGKNGLEIKTKIAVLRVPRI